MSATNEISRAVTSQARIDRILSLRRFAVVGASRDPAKYGYKVYRALKAAGYEVRPVNPNAAEVDGDPCYPEVETLPERPDCVVTVTQPAVTEQVVQAAARAGVPFLWMQPGSGSLAAYNLALAHAMQVVWDGPCIMVALASRSRA